MAPRVGFEPTTDRLTADCSTTELPRIKRRHLNLKRRLIADLKAEPNTKITFCASKKRRKSKKLEATPGIEPGYTDLQSAASPLRHVANHAKGARGSFPLPI